MIANTRLARKKMLEGQIYTNRVLDKNILAALSITAREAFVPEEYKDSAYIDADIKVGKNRVILEPLVFARLLKLAEITPSSHVLDIASATGYSSVVIAHLAEDVVAVESDSSLISAASVNLNKVEVENVNTVNADLASGAPEHKPYDAIIINGMVEQVPENLFKQLRTGGRLVTIVAEDKLGYITVFTKTEKQVSAVKYEQAFSVLLPEFMKPKKFVF